MSIIFSERIHTVKCKFGHGDRKCVTCGIKYKHCDCFVEYTTSEDDLVEYRYLFCHRKYQNKFDEKLKERVFNRYKFSNHGSDNFILLLRKGVYRYENINNWKKLNETLLTKKRDF